MLPIGRRDSVASLDELPVWAFASAQPASVTPITTIVLPSEPSFANAEMEMVS
jgi:hypothetical protein